MNDAGLQSRSSRVGRSSSFFPSSIRAIFCSAGSLASTVRSAGSSVVSSVASTITTASEDRQREQVQWAGFDRIELGPANIRHVLLLTYLKGFQVWDVEDADDVWKLVSKGDGPVACLRVQPQLSVGMFDGGLNAARPLLLVVTTDATNCRSTGIPSGLPNGYGRVVGSPPSVGDNHFVPTLVKFYSLRSHTYVHTLRFRTAIYAVRCSSRVVAVALATQLYCFDAATLQSTFSVLTYPSPQPGSSGLNFGYGAVAVGPRWLAYAANQPVVSNTGRVSPQHLTPSPGVSPSTSPANGSLVACYAKESSKQLAAGIVTLGYKTFSRYCTEGIGSPELGSPLQKNSCNGHPEHAGTVIVRDFVSKVVVSQFRAHRSPLSALCFDPTGTLLVTASIRGHNINIFRIMPVSNVNGANSSSYDASASHVHLYKLSRGMTNAVIQDIAFTEDSHWIVVSSSRGTNHLFAISPFGGAVGPSTHGPGPVDQAVGTFAPMRLFPWWSNMGPVRSSQQASSNPPPTVSSSVVSRIKNGNGGWGGTVSGAAAAAAATSGRTCSSLGAVAVFFHDGRGHKLDTEAGQTILKEQLWVLFPSGHLIRYALHLSAGTEGYPDNVSSAMAPGSPKETLDLRVVEKPLQKWDVCRRQNWVEREEKIDIPSSLDAAHEEAGTSSGTSIGLYNNGALGRELMTPEEMHRWFLSNAEVQMHHFRPTLWAKSQISFHVFAGVAHSRVFEKEDSGGEVEIEKVLTHVVEVRKKDLVPFDRLRNYQFGEDARDTNMLLRGTLNSSSLHSGMQYGFIGTDVGGIHIQRSSSGSSCGSDGSSYSGPNVGQNSVHHSHQDSPQDLQIQSLPFSFPHQSKQNQFYVKKTEVRGTHFPSVDLMKENKNVIPTSLGSPLVDIPYLSHQDSHDRSPKPGEKPEINCPVGQELQERERAILPLQGEGEGAMMKIESSCDVNLPCEGQVDVGSIPNGYFTSQGVFKNTDPAAIRSDNQRVAPAVEGACLHTLQTPDLDQAFGRVFSDTLNHVGKFDLQDNDAATEDVESTDGNSKSEDFGGEQGEDGWEGDIFPFAEDC